MDLATGVIKEVINGFPNVLEICGQEILEKASLLKQVPSHWLHQHIDSTISFDGNPHAGLMSSVASIHDDIVICDAVEQMVLKLCKKTGILSSFQFSNFGILGLPYWLSFSLESVYPGVQVNHIQRFTLLPGRIEAQLTIDIPEGTELVEPLQEGCIWRQARGTGADILGTENETTSLEKVGAAQQWYNDLDNLASLTQEIELPLEEEKNSSEGQPKDGKVRIDCIVNTSPGTCEVIVYAALYLRMKRPSKPSDDTREKQVAKLVNPGGSGNEHLKTDACLKLLSSERELEEFVFVRPLLVRLQIDCLDHPKADNSKDIILTDASIEAEPIFRDPNRFSELADPMLGGDFPMKSFNQAVAVSAMCLNDDASVHPLISDVVSALSFLGMMTEQDTEGSTSPISMPSPPASTHYEDADADADASERERAVAEAIERGSNLRNNMIKSMASTST